MATYFLFGKYTAEAVKNMSPDRTAKAGELVKKFGGEIESIYALMGEKDLVIIARFPGAEKAMMSSIELCKLTGIAFTTSEAIAVADFDKMTAGL